MMDKLIGKWEIASFKGKPMTGSFWEVFEDGTIIQTRGDMELTSKWEYTEVDGNKSFIIKNEDVGLNIVMSVEYLTDSEIKYIDKGREVIMKKMI